MTATASGRPVAILAGGGSLPPLVAAAARREGRAPVVLTIAREADPNAFDPCPVYVVGWGEIGRMFRLMEEAACRDVVLIAVTGWGQEADRKLSREAGFDRHLVKPITVAALEAAIASLPPPSDSPKPGGAELTVS